MSDIKKKEAAQNPAAPAHQTRPADNHYRYRRQLVCHPRLRVALVLLRRLAYTRYRRK